IGGSDGGGLFGVFKHYNFSLTFTAIFVVENCKSVTSGNIHRELQIGADDRWRCVLPFVRKLLSFARSGAVEQYAFVGTSYFIGFGDHGGWREGVDGDKSFGESRATVFLIGDHEGVSSRNRNVCFRRNCNGKLIFIEPFEREVIAAGAAASEGYKGLATCQNQSFTGISLGVLSIL